MQAGINVTARLLQRFPRDVWAEVVSTYGPVDLGTTIMGRVEGAMPEPRTSRYVLLNVQRVAPIEGIGAPPAGRVLLRIAHPLQFLPYQYDSGGPDTRSILRSADISMRLIDTQPLERDEEGQTGRE